MADATTYPKLYNHSNRQRIETTDLNEQTALAQDLDEELAWAMLSASNCVIDGLHVDFSSGVEFVIGAGAAIWGGQVLKDAANPNNQYISLDTNGSADPRIDVIYIAGPQQAPTNSVSKTLLSAYTRTPVSGEAVGTGDGSTKAFDLANSGVDPRTLKVQIATVAAGGWNLSPGTGGSGKDQIIFGVAPASGAITADYTYESGGAEGASSVATRQTVTPQILEVAGTPDPSPSVPATPSPNTDIVLAHVYIPGSWSGGAPGDWPGSPPDPPYNPDNSVKKYFLHPDRHIDPSCPVSTTPPNANAPRAGRVSSLLRNMDQVYTGGRLRLYSADGTTPSDDTVELTAMWSTLGGYSIFSSDDSISMQLVYAATITQPNHVDAIGWWFIYLNQANDEQPGVAPTLLVSPNPPNSRRRESVADRWLYVGAVYVTSVSPVTIRPFYTHGQWVYWQTPAAINLDLPATPGGPSPANDGAVDVSAWCPKTGRLLHGRLEIAFNAASDGDGMEAVVQSHREATALPNPILHAQVYAPGTGTYGNTSIGILRAEEYEGFRYVNSTVGIHLPYDSSGTYAKLYIQGYLDDYRTMDQDGNIPTIY